MADMTGTLWQIEVPWNCQTYRQDTALAEQTGTGNRTHEDIIRLKESVRMIRSSKNIRNCILLLE